MNFVVVVWKRAQVFVAVVKCYRYGGSKFEDKRGESSFVHVV